MNRNFLITLASALLVFVVGTGIGRVNGPEQGFQDFHVLARDADGRPLPTLPTVFVSATVPADVEADSTQSFDHAVTNARSALAGRVNSGIRRVGLAIPYYAFGRNARTSE